MQVIDLKRRWRSLYSPRPGGYELVEVPELAYLAIDGRIEPGSSPGASPGYAAAVGALYGLAYTLRFSLKRRAVEPLDYPVMPLEGLWWTDGPFDLARKDNWRYTAMILVPDEVAPAEVADGLAALRARRGDQPEFSRLRLERFAEGRCVQVLHVGPYASEPETLAQLPDFLGRAGLVDEVGADRRHHEIYLSDPNRTAAEKLRTIVRHPVARA